MNRQLDPAAKLFCKGLAYFTTGTNRSVHILRKTNDNFLDLMLTGQFSNPLVLVALPPAFNDFHALGGPSEHIANRNADSAIPVVQTHNFHAILLTVTGHVKPYQFFDQFVAFLLAHKTSSIVVARNICRIP